MTWTVPVNRITDTSENITFPCTTYVVGNKRLSLTVGFDINAEFLEYLSSVECRILIGSEQKRYAVIGQELSVT